MWETLQITHLRRLPLYRDLLHFALLLLLLLRLLHPTLSLSLSLLTLALRLDPTILDQLHQRLIRSITRSRTVSALLIMLQHGLDELAIAPVHRDAAHQVVLLWSRFHVADNVVQLLALALIRIRIRILVWGGH